MSPRNRDSDNHPEFDDTVCIGETDLAIQVRGPNIPGGQAWVPKSVIDDDSDVWERETSGTLIVHEWWARKEQWV